MNKQSWFSFIAILCCFAAGAQQNDTASSAQQAVVVAKGSLFTNFSCVVKEHNKILLQWAADSIKDGEYFVVEHSNDGDHYETVGALKGMSYISKYELTDNAPFNGSNFYKIRYTGKTGWENYSKTVQVAVSQNAAFRFYPNPADNSLIIQIDHAADMQILSSLGAVLLNKQLQPGLQVINVTALEKGNYFLRITDKQSNRDLTEHFLKN